MAGTFSMRMDELSRQVGIGELTGVVEFDQVYAHRQHEDLLFKHPHGGGPLYLNRALLEHGSEALWLLANKVLDDPKEAMVEATEFIAKHASDNAPVREVANLAHSDHVTVFDNGAIVYDRPAEVPRLGPKAIELFNRELQDSDHWYGRWPRVV